MIHFVINAMQHGYVCWAEFHRIGHWYEYLCRKP